MSTRRPPGDAERPASPLPMMAARGVVLVAVAVALGLLLLRWGLDGPSSAEAIGTGPDNSVVAGGGGTTGGGTGVTTTAVAPAPSTTLAAALDPNVKVIIANGSGIGGVAKRISDRVGALGALMGNPTNAAAKVDATTVYFANPAAEPTARKVAEGLSSTTVQVKAAPLPSADLVEKSDIQGAGVVVVVGRDLGTS